MTALEELHEAARAERDAAIAEAKAEYRQTVNQLNAIARRLGQPLSRKRPYISQRMPKPLATEFSEMTSIQAAEAVLRECGPLSSVELTVEVMRRG